MPKWGKVRFGKTLEQGVLSWRASGDRQISLSASDERVFANFRVKTSFLQVHIFVLCFQWWESARL